MSVIMKFQCVSFDNTTTVRQLLIMMTLRLMVCGIDVEKVC